MFKKIFLLNQKISDIMSKLQNKKFLYLLSGTEPSSFVRAVAYKDEFKKRSIQVDYYKLNSKIILKSINYYSSFYPAQLLFRILNKLYFQTRQYYLLNRVSEYDVIIAVKYFSSELLKQIKSKTKAFLIYDFDDAVWLDTLYGKEEFSNIISTVDCVTSDNSYLAKHAFVYNKKSFVVNGPCQIEKFISYKNSDNKLASPDKTITLGWVGSPSTLFYLYKIYDALEIIGAKYSNVILKLVGTGSEKLLIPPFEKIKVVSIATYDQNEMIKQVYSFDIGLYPLFLNELSLGRGSLKATVYMSGSVPVVCSAIGENTNIIQDGINGFLAANTEEWVEKLSLLIENPTLSKEIGENGFIFAEANYSINNCISQLLNVASKLYN